MVESNLGIGPMSTEVVEAVFRESEEMPLMLIASRNQIDSDRGYVNNWNTREFMSYVNRLRKKYNKSNVIVCRDHCGPGFKPNEDDIESVYATMEEDIKNGFDLIHIDFCKLKDEDEIKKESKRAIEYCLSLNPKLMLETGTDENVGKKYNKDDLVRFSNQMDSFLEFCSPLFYVIQTGSLIMEDRQTGSFNIDFIKLIKDIAERKGIKLKEHNADYLTMNEIKRRKGLIDALNVAPQFGVAQTNYVLNRCNIYGIDPSKFLYEVYNGRRWSKWILDENKNDKRLCSIVAGHYHFSSIYYNNMIEELEKREDIFEGIVNIHRGIIKHYKGGLK